MSKKPKDGTSKTNVTARKKEKPRAVVLVYESYTKPSGATGLHKRWEDA
jgi:hypothetical protein